jgi:hypothetical protein
MLVEEATGFISNSPVRGCMNHYSILSPTASALARLPRYRKNSKTKASACCKSEGARPRGASASSRTPTSARPFGAKASATAKSVSPSASSATTYGNSPPWPRRNAWNSKPNSQPWHNPSDTNPPQRQGCAQIGSKPGLLRAAEDWIDLFLFPLTVLVKRKLRELENPSITGQAVNSR